MARDCHKNFGFFLNAVALARKVFLSNGLWGDLRARKDRLQQVFETDSLRMMAGISFVAIGFALPQVGLFPGRPMAIAGNALSGLRRKPVPVI